MKPILARIVVAMALAFCSSRTFAQKSAPPNRKISVAEILDKHAAAMGGLEALRALQTIHAEGSFGVPPAHRSGDFNFYYKSPASDLFQLDETSHGQFLIGHRGGAPFVRHSPQSFAALNGVTVNILEENWLGLIEWKTDERYARIEVLGLTQIDGKWAYALGFRPKEGDRQVRYYDSESFLLVRMDLAQRIRQTKDGPESAYKVETYYSDYRNSAGLNLPAKIRSTASNGSLELEIHKIRVNEPVEDSVFVKN